MLATSIAAFALTLWQASPTEPSKFAEETSEVRGEIPEGIELQPEARFKDPDTFPLRARWSKDGAVFAYIGYKDSKKYPVTHGPETFEPEVGDAYDFIDAPTVAEQGQRVAFRVGNTLNKKRERWWVWIDGKAQYKEDWIGAVALSPDGERLAYWSQPDAEVGPDGAYIPNPLIFRAPAKKSIRKPMQWDEADALTPPVFHPDSNKAFALALKDGEWFVIGRGKKRFEAISEGYSSISGLQVAGRSIAFSALVNELVRGAINRNHRAVLNGEPLKTQHVTTNWPTLSADGKHVAYKYVSFTPKMGIIIDKETGKEPGFDYVGRAVWDAKGSGVAFLSVADTNGVDPAALKIRIEPEPRGGEWRLSQMDRRSKAVSTSERFWHRLRNPSFSKDGKRVTARVMSDEGWHAVVFDNQGKVLAESPPHDEVGIPHFAGDDDAVLYGTRDGRKFSWVRM